MERLIPVARCSHELYDEGIGITNGFVPVIPRENTIK